MQDALPENAVDNVHRLPLAAVARAPRPRVYRGVARTTNGRPEVSVTIDGAPLAWRLDVANHSPGGLGWGYAGSGAAQLAVAILCDALGDVARAIRLYQRFKFAWVARLPMHRDWSITQDEVREIVEAIERAETAVAGGV